MLSEVTKGTLVGETSSLHSECSGRGFERYGLLTSRMVGRFAILGRSPMHFWRKDYFQTLKDVATEARTVPAWADYAAFCEEYERGLRDKAFNILERFTSSMERAPFAERRRFVSWLSQRADHREGRHMLIPHHFYIRIVEPTLLEWTAVEPDCPEPHVWLGGYDHVKRAFELEPNNQMARRKLLLLVWGRVDFEAYEHGCSKNFDKDMATLSEVEELLRGLSNEEDRKKLAADLAEDRRFVEQHSRKRSGQ